MQENLKNKALSILEVAVENTNDAFVTIDENHKVIFFNRAAERIFGYSREEVVNRDLDTIMSPECSRNHRAAVRHYVRTKIPRRIGHGTEIDAVRKNGETFPAEISFSVSELEGRLYFTGIVRDLTETKALQEKIQKSERLAALGQLVAEITHEIKNPLVMIGGYARQLLKGNWDEKTHTKLNIIVDEVSRLEGLLQELREFYLQRKLKLEEVDINHLLQDVFSLVEGDCEEKQIHLDFKPNKGPVTVDGDKEKLKQVFLNLINNSIDAMEKKGTLTVETELSGDLATITLADNGCGIPEKYKEEIFSPFFTTKKHGTGLGLGITKRIIEEHEGSSLTVDSKEGKGTVFKITMPVYHEADKDGVNTQETT